MIPPPAYTDKAEGAYLMVLAEEAWLDLSYEVSSLF